eukprot:snap_masked-scaffold_48-processed-gene-1.116-mRNA-1 protein AED:0.19 eAED:1.00 QI:0/-1/0/1/-1/1/1/0/330
MTERRKAIIVFGRTGQGKSSFINALTGSELEVGHNLNSCTDEVAVVDYRDGVVIDTPGFGDVRKDGNNLTTEEIIRMIALQCNRFKVIGFVCMIGLVQLMQKEDRQLFDVVYALNRRFLNFHRMVEYGFKDSLGCINQLVLQGAAMQNKEKFRRLNLQISHVHVCTRLDFTNLIEIVRRKFKETDPDYLEPTGFLLKCNNCTKIADPVLCISECRSHVTTTPRISKHGKLVSYHRTDKMHKFHSGYCTKSVVNKYWTCCDNPADHLGCKEGFSCCENKGPGCRKRCESCGEDSETQGCIGFCEGCERALFTLGCKVRPKHAFMTLMQEID